MSELDVVQKAKSELFAEGEIPAELKNFNEIKSYIDIKKEMFEGVPGWLMVTVVPTAGDTKWNPKALEDHAATACAVQNFMLSLASEGLGSKWMTGAMGIPPPKLMELVGADEATEHFMGIVFFGRPQAPMSEMPVPKRKTGLAEPVLTTLP